MKRIYLLVICLVALLMPQFAYAQAVLNNGTLTVTTTQPGQVSGYVSGLTSEQKASVTSIVLIGKFNEGDLQAIQNSQGYTAVTTVDMSEAKFVTTVSGYTSNYKLFQSEASGGASLGTHAIVGGTLYVSAYNQSRVWNTYWGTPSEESARVLSSTSDVQSTDNVGDYGKIQKATDGVKYLQMSVTETPKAWSSPVQASPWDNSVKSDIDDETSTTNAAFLSSKLDDDVSCPAGSTVKVVCYFEWVVDQETNIGTWIEISRSDFNTKNQQYNNDTSLVAQGVFANPGLSSNDFNDVLNGDSHTRTDPNTYLLWLAVSYTKIAASETREWTNETTTAPDGYNTANDATFDYAFRDSHKDGYANGTWVKMIDYDYYQLANGSSSWGWEQVNYTDGQDQYINVRYADETAKDADNSWPNNANQYALVGGTEYIYDDTSWKLPSEVTNYADMKFTYWKETITTAITSKYANETISDQIFQECKKLTSVNFKAGNVTGFQDHKIVNGYNTTDNSTLTTGLSVTIGKNVTKISSAAFQRCDVLTSLTFDKDYAESNPDMLTGVTYPFNLDIGEAAFQQCINLSGVEFPNRVRSIGNIAFEHAGDSVEVFTVSFERRSLDFGPDVSIAYFVNLTIGNSAFAYCSKLKTISLPIRLESLGNDAFKNSGLEHFEIREDREDSYLTTIPTGAFSYTKLQEIVIPRSVTEIMDNAFSNTPTVKTIIFQESNQDPQPSLYIHSGAFAGGNERDSQLSDVYVNIDPSKRKMICEYDAFNFTYLVGQTSSENTMAKLHFPEEFWDYYQGEWKRGIAFTQDMLTRFKDGYNDDNTTPRCVGKSNGSIDTQSGKYETGNDATQYAPANGWQQFAQSYSTIDIVLPLGLFLRSYSTPVPLAIPVFPSDGGNTYHHSAGAPMFKVYRITNFSDGTTEAAERPGESVTPTATATEIVERVGGNGALYIPANTGVILVGYIDPSYMVYLSKIENAEVNANVTYPFNETIAENATTGTTNLLYPTCIDNQRPEGTDTYKDGAPKVLTDAVNGETWVQLNPTIPYPYTTSAHPLQYRLFGLSSSTQGSFNRLKKDVKMSRDKAYLKLNTNLFHYSNEGADASGSGVPIGSSSAPIMMTFVDEGGETTDVRLVDPVTMTFVDDCYYTLQGVKMNARPTQAGIYIHNGKKIVIK